MQGGLLLPRHDIMSFMIGHTDIEQRRDELLNQLLKTAPQPRPKRERGEAKPTQKPAKRASVRKPAPSA